MADMDDLAPGALGSTLPFEPSLSWSAIFAGAAVAVAASLFMTLLGTGFGYALLPAGPASRDALAGFSPEVGAGAVAAQVVAAALGGYLAGRLRTRWTAAHDDEAHFRDTAHGLIAWAVSALIGVVLAASVLGPAAEHAAAVAPVVNGGDADRAAHIAAQAALFVAMGMLLSAFTAAVAARIGGMRNEEMHARMMG